MDLLINVENVFGPAKLYWNIIKVLSKSVQIIWMAVNITLRVYGWRNHSWSVLCCTFKFISQLNITATWKEQRGSSFAICFSIVFFLPICIHPFVCLLLTNFAMTISNRVWSNVYISARSGIPANRKKTLEHKKQLRMIPSNGHLRTDGDSVEWNAASTIMPRPPAQLYVVAPLSITRGEVG